MSASLKLRRGPISRPEAPPKIDYIPRRWARPFHASLKRWAVLVLHRRAGKTTAFLNHHIRAACSDAWETRRILSLKPDITKKQLDQHLRVRLYGHILPQRNQAKLTSWEMLKYYASFVPGAAPNASELYVDFPVVRGGKAAPGHLRRVQLFGADNIDALRGTGFCGLTLDEFAQHPPTAFGSVLSKALAEHLGYCVWGGTIIGKNQLWQTYHQFKGEIDAFTLWQDIDTSLMTEAPESVALLAQALRDDRELVAKGVMTQDEYDQEWYLSVAASIRGAYYSEQLRKARNEGRITRVPFDPLLPVDTDWDIGVDDETAIWFSQSLRSREVRLIDYVRDSGKGVDHYWRELQRLQQERGYVYGKHWGPHDIKVREWGTGKTRLETALSLGLRFEVTPGIGLADGINATRLLLPRCWFDEQRCGDGLEALSQYRKAWDDKKKLFREEPEHGWPSHGADAFRGLATRHQVPAAPAAHRPPPMMPMESGRGTGWMGT